MKIRFFSVFSITLTVLMLLIFSLSSTPDVKTTENGAENVKTEVITVADQVKQKPDSSKVLESRFLNLLNHNFVYNSDFDTIENIVNESVIALLDMRDSEDDSYISENIVKDYIFNMYGIEIDDFSSFNADFPKRSGYVYIIPRGYSTYEHQMVSVTENEDGSYTTKTKVTVSSHDGIEMTDFCETLFIVNENSAFGFSIISSDIESSALTI